MTWGWEYVCVFCIYVSMCVQDVLSSCLGLLIVKFRLRSRFRSFWGGFFFFRFTFSRRWLYGQIFSDDLNEFLVSYLNFCHIKYYLLLYIFFKNKGKRNEEKAHITLCSNHLPPPPEIRSLDFVIRSHMDWMNWLD